MWAEISPEFLILIALWILVIPPRWAAGIMLAVTVHELFHIGALLAVGGSAQGIRLQNGGIYLVSGQMCGVRAWISAAAGPVGSFTLLGLRNCFPEAAIFGLGQGLFNLIPVYPFDGGRMVQAFLEKIPVYWADFLQNMLRICTALLLTGLCISAVRLFPSVGVWFVAGTGFALWRIFSKNSLQ